MAWWIFRRIYWFLKLYQWTCLSSLLYFFAYRFLCFLYASSFSLDGSRQYLFFSLVLVYIAFWNSLFIKGAWLPLTNFFFKGTCLSIASKKFSVMDFWGCGNSIGNFHTPKNITPEQALTTASPDVQLAVTCSMTPQNIPAIAIHSAKSVQIWGSFIGNFHIPKIRPQNKCWHQQALMHN